MKDIIRKFKLKQSGIIITLPALLQKEFTKAGRKREQFSKMVGLRPKNMQLI